MEGRQQLKAQHFIQSINENIYVKKKNKYMYIDIGICISKSISIYVCRAASIWEGLQGIKARKQCGAVAGGTAGRRRRDVSVQSLLSLAGTVGGFWAMN